MEGWGEERKKNKKKKERKRKRETKEPPKAKPIPQPVGCDSLRKEELSCPLAVGAPAERSRGPTPLRKGPAIFLVLLLCPRCLQETLK